MTLTGRRDGADAAPGASYLELARVLMDHGARPPRICASCGRASKLNVSEADNALDLALAREVAPTFRVKPRVADEIITRQRALVRQWPKLAKHLGITVREQASMASAFRLA